MAARNPRDQAFRAALDGIAAGLAVPLAAGEVGAHFLFGQRLEAYLRLAQPLTQRAVGGEQGDGGEHAVAAARHQLRSEERTYELQSLMRISYAVVCLEK